MGKMDKRLHFHGLTIALHWLVVLLVIAVYVSMEFRGYFPKGSDMRNNMKMMHFIFGLSIFSLVWVRLLARYLWSTPDIVPAPPQWQQRSAKTAHALLYVFMIAMPLLGWLILSGEGKSVLLFGMQLPLLMEPDKAFAHDMEELHEWGGTLGYALIGLHALAGLVHHYVMKDNTLRRMLPHR